jgi:hypothetical protein
MDGRSAASGLRFPEVIGLKQETIQHTFVVPRGEVTADFQTGQD